VRIEHVAQEPGQVVGQLGRGLVNQLEEDVDVALVHTEDRGKVGRRRRHGGDGSREPGAQLVGFQKSA
jgi:hypothetical protein